jgi:hypothetical protein
MAFMYVTEYAGLGSSNNGTDVQAVAAPPLVEQPRVAISGASAASAAFGPNTTLVRIEVDAICSVNVGGNAATTNSGRMVAGQTEYFRVAPGQVANVISNT